MLENGTGIAMTVGESISIIIFFFKPSFLTEKTE